MKKFLAIFTPALLFVPTLVHAQDLGWFTRTLTQLQSLVNALVPFFIGAAVVLFLYGIAKYILAAGDEGERGEGLKFIIWGVVGIFVAVSIWGFVSLLQGFFGVGGVGAPPVVPLPPR